MSKFLSFLDAIFAAILSAFSPAPTPKPSAPEPPAAAPQEAAALAQVSKVTADGLNALEKVFGPVIDILRGKGTLSEDEEAANAVANIVATLNPELAPEIGLIEAAEPMAKYIFGLLKNGGAFAPAPAGGPPITQAEPFNPNWGHDPRASNPSGEIGGGGQSPS